jgi:hypothetical protein
MNPNECTPAEKPSSPEEIPPEQAAQIAFGSVRVWSSAFTARSRVTPVAPPPKDYGETTGV